jgi:7,8-dihydroneopterin aldolase/epimerase/oxygenase
MSVTVELSGLEIQGRHGVEEEERANPQLFVYDLWLDVPDAALSDRIEDTVDYREVVSCVREISDGRQFQLLEGMAAAVADALLARFRLEGVRVRVKKPQVQLDAPVGWTAATVERARP